MRPKYHAYRYSTHDFCYGKDYAEIQLYSVSRLRLVRREEYCYGSGLDPIIC